MHNNRPRGALNPKASCAAWMQNINVPYVALGCAAHCTKAQSILFPFFFWRMQLMLSDTITTPDFKPCVDKFLFYVRIIFQIAFISLIVLVFFVCLFFLYLAHMSVVTKRSLAWTRQQVRVTWFMRKLRGPPHLFPLGKCFVHTSPSARPSLCSPRLRWLFRLDAFPRFSSKLVDSHTHKPLLRSRSSPRIPVPSHQALEGTAAGRTWKFT